jgi:hypothetical protein
MITWKFEELPVTFKSKQANLIRDISKMAHANHIDPSSKITIIDLYGEPNHTTFADAFGSHGNTATTAQSTLSVDTEEDTPSEQEADELPTVLLDLDDADPDLDLLG